MRRRARRREPYATRSGRIAPDASGAGQAPRTRDRVGHLVQAARAPWQIAGAAEHGIDRRERSTQPHPGAFPVVRHPLATAETAPLACRDPHRQCPPRKPPGGDPRVRRPPEGGKRERPSPEGDDRRQPSPEGAGRFRTGRHDLAVAAGPAREGETNRFIPRRRRPPSGWTRPPVPDKQGRERSPPSLSPKPSTDYRRADRRNRARRIFGTAASALSRCT